MTSGENVSFVIQQEEIFFIFRELPIAISRIFYEVLFSILQSGATIKSE